jgi:hypothetical protein
MATATYKTTTNTQQIVSYKQALEAIGNMPSLILAPSLLHYTAVVEFNKRLPHLNFKTIEDIEAWHPGIPRSLIKYTLQLRRDADLQELAKLEEDLKEENDREWNEYVTAMLKKGRWKRVWGRLRR